MPDDLDDGDGVGYQRSGWGGQRVYMFPDLDLIVILPVGYYAEDDPSNAILRGFILPEIAY